MNHEMTRYDVARDVAQMFRILCADYSNRHGIIYSKAIMSAMDTYIEKWYGDKNENTEMS